MAKPIDEAASVMVPSAAMNRCFGEVGTVAMGSDWSEIRAKPTGVGGYDYR